jgi:ubiquinone/menaquinone biosynthesis C-methylase UbiE
MKSSDQLDMSTSATGGAQAIFNRQLATYRKIVAANCMSHREVYDVLRRALSLHMRGPFSFLDIACGDASASAAVLKDTRIAHYYGIDLSEASLAIAKGSLKLLSCPVELHCRDSTAAMRSWSSPVDFVWIGMSLHHQQKAEKFELARNVRRVMNRDGVFMVWEPTLLESETRGEWLDRFLTCRPDFGALTDEEFAELYSHMCAADFPETAEDWRAIGLEAGFGQSAEIFIMQNRMGRMFKYWN